MWRRVSQGISIAYHDEDSGCEGRDGGVSEVHQAYVHTRIRTGRETRDLGHGPWNMRGGTWDLGPGTRDMRHGTRDMRLGTRDLRCVGIQAIIMYTDGAPSNDADMWGEGGGWFVSITILI